MKKAILLTVSSCIFFIFSEAQTSIPPIAGWKHKVVNSTYVYTPGNSSTEFSYEVMPLQSPRNDMDEWLGNSVKNYIATAGFNAPTPGAFKVMDVHSFKTCAAMTTDKSGKKWTVLSMAYQTPAGKMRHALMKMLGTTDNTNMNVAIKHFMELSKKEGMAAGTAANKSSSPTIQKSNVESVGQATAVSGKGSLKASDIKGIVMNTEYGTGVGGMITVEHRPYLLLTNGQLYKHIKVSPYELDVQKSKQTEPEKWGTWKLQGKTLIVQIPEKGVMKTKQWTKNWYWARPASNGEKINGSFKTIKGGGNTALGGNTMVVAGSNISFNSNGRFSLEKYSGGSSSDAGVGVTTHANDNAAGTYKLNGYSIELHYNNGDVVKQVFYFYPDSKETFGIGGSNYVPVRK